MNKETGDKTFSIRLETTWKNLNSRTSLFSPADKSTLSIQDKSNVACRGAGHPKIC